MLRRELHDADRQAAGEKPCSWNRRSYYKENKDPKRMGDMKIGFQEGLLCAFGALGGLPRMRGADPKGIAGTAPRPVASRLE